MIKLFPLQQERADFFTDHSRREQKDFFLFLPSSELLGMGKVETPPPALSLVRGLGAVAYLEASGKGLQICKVGHVSPCFLPGDQLS